MALFVSAMLTCEDNLANVVSVVGETGVMV